MSSPSNGSTAPDQAGRQRPAVALTPTSLGPNLSTTLRQTMRVTQAPPRSFDGMDDLVGRQLSPQRGGPRSADHHHHHPPLELRTSAGAQGRPRMHRSASSGSLGANAAAAATALTTASDTPPPMFSPVSATGPALPTAPQPSLHRQQPVPRPLVPATLTWRALLESFAGIPPERAAKYAMLFEQEAMPPPTSPLCQDGIDNDLLMSIGVTAGGDRCRILAACRQTLTIAVGAGAGAGAGAGGGALADTAPAPAPMPVPVPISVTTSNTLLGSQLSSSPHAAANASFGGLRAGSRKARRRRLPRIYLTRGEREVNGGSDTESATSSSSSRSSSDAEVARDRKQNSTAPGSPTSPPANLLQVETASRATTPSESIPLLPHSPALDSTAVTSTTLRRDALACEVKAIPSAHAEREDIVVLFDDSVVQTNIFTSYEGCPEPFVWVDISGRDRGREEYRDALAVVAEKYGFAESLLLDIDLTLALPQVITSQEEPNQFLIILRVATDVTDIEEDALHLLTNRWMLAVNMENQTIVTIHRADTRSLAVLRTTFEEMRWDFVDLLLKLLDDSLLAYIDALHESEFLLDQYESVMLRHSVSGARGTSKEWAGRVPQAALDKIGDPNKLTRRRMNQLLYHLHRRCSVYSRMLSLMQDTLESAFTMLRICTPEFAEQMSRSCGELAVKADALHDNSQHLLNLHLSLVSFHTNELMGILTTFSAFFTPLTFICGVYGMNFVVMPELEYQNGYYFCLGGMGLVTLIIYAFFRFKGLM